MRLTLREVVLESGGLLRGSSGPALERVLLRQSGIHYVDANYLSDTATIGYDEAAISEPDLRRLIEECGYHCRGEIVPRHLCAPGPDLTIEHRPWATAPD